jgi:hypothetical protein
MFDWLSDEMAGIRTDKFHFVDGPASPEFRAVVEKSDFPLPPSYKEFVLRFGNSKLYRRISSFNSYYLIEVYAGPRQAKSEEGESLIQFGRTQTSLAYFKESLLSVSGESAVFEWRHRQGIRKTAEGFLEWLKAKCQSARKKYKKQEWEAIQNGPPPFTDMELAVIEARKSYRWRVVGISPNGDLQFEVHNGSNMNLPYLTLDVRGKMKPPNDGFLTGGARLSVASIYPGETKYVEFDCYKKFVAPEDIEVFEPSEPGPEDREVYWEFRALA